MKKILTTSLAGLLVLGGCAFGSDENSNTSGDQNEDEKDKTQQEEKNQNENQDNTKDEKDSDMNNNDSDESSKSDKNNDDTQNNEENNDENNQSSDKDSNNTEAKHPMNKDRAQTELEEYEEAFKKVISYTKDDGELKEYKTKDKLKEHFMHFMSAEQADELINTYFEMQDDALHVKAMDGPKFLDSDQPFEFKQGSNGNYKVVQETDNELNGHIKTTYTLTVNDGGYWIIQDVTSESLE
ncbi:hypothetical protein [Pontibacillus marinus]|uniref:Lipoprotein n=1 Tax=Pontibacillus marinus BH030004 = DSM 16465 TaxID=1385511 RepID=A0A0A5GEP5_9BACI|nr:hypothetical protein [Pontibacillus marinus]KGX89585.1 hypothetical protein N783_05485 [Pontibacillus marinus BH030004 = DSM 16465]